MSLSRHIATALTVMGLALGSLVACDGDSSSDGVTAAELNTLCQQLDTKIAACASEPNMTFSCDATTPSTCRNQLAAFATCANQTSVDVCQDGGASACEAQATAVFQCAIAYCQAHPDDENCQ